MAYIYNSSCMAYIYNSSCMAYIYSSSCNQYRQLKQLHFINNYLKLQSGLYVQLKSCNLK
jgi:hypothetical protein